MDTLGPDSAVYAGDGDWIAFEDFCEADDGFEFSSRLEELEWEAEMRLRYPDADMMVLRHFLRLVGLARDYAEDTGRHLDVSGVLGELFGAVQYGIRLHRAKAQGSDGRLNNDFVEIKTIGPTNTTGKVHVKCSGHFSRLLLVRISETYEFQSHMICRSLLGKRGEGRFGIAWRRAEGLAREPSG